MPDLVTIADYHVLLDGVMTFSPLPGGGAIRQDDVHFRPPDDIILGQSVSRPMLAFTLRPEADADLTLRVRIARLGTGKDCELLVLPVAAGPAQSLHQVLEIGQLHAGNNRIRFGADPDGTGRVAVTGVVMWYRRRAERTGASTD